LFEAVVIIGNIEGGIAYDDGTENVLNGYKT
jgi:hypothetical protein